MDDGFGSLEAEEGRHGRVNPLAQANDSVPYGDVELSFDYRGEGACGPAPDDEAFSTGGIWYVVRGGSFGGTVEIEARDVTFGPTSPGHDIRLTRMYWRVAIRDLSVPDAGPRPPDAGQ